MEAKWSPPNSTAGAILEQTNIIDDTSRTIGPLDSSLPKVEAEKVNGGKYKALADISNRAAEFTGKALTGIGKDVKEELSIRGALEQGMNQGLSESILEQKRNPILKALVGENPTFETAAKIAVENLGNQSDLDTEAYLKANPGVTPEEFKKHREELFKKLSEKLSGDESSVMKLQEHFIKSSVELGRKQIKNYLAAQVSANEEMYRDSLRFRSEKYQESLNSAIASNDTLKIKQLGEEFFKNINDFGKYKGISEDMHWSAVKDIISSELEQGNISIYNAFKHTSFGNSKKGRLAEIALGKAVANYKTQFNGEVTSDLRDIEEAGKSGNSELVTTLTENLKNKVFMKGADTEHKASLTSKINLAVYKNADGLISANTASYKLLMKDAADAGDSKELQEMFKQAITSVEQNPMLPDSLHKRAAIAELKDTYKELQKTRVLQDAKEKVVEIKTRDVSNAGSLAYITAAKESTHNINAWNDGSKAGSKSEVKLTKRVTEHTVGELLAKGRGFYGRLQAGVHNGALDWAVSAGEVSKDELFTKEVQDKVYVKSIFNKRKELGNYLRGTSDNLHKAVTELSQEYAVFKNASGKGTYDGLAGNKASLDGEGVLRKVRALYKAAIDGGATPEEAEMTAVFSSTPAQKTSQGSRKLDVAEDTAHLQVESAQSYAIRKGYQEQYNDSIAKFNKSKDLSHLNALEDYLNVEMNTEKNADNRAYLSHLLTQVSSTYTKATGVSHAREEGISRALEAVKGNIDIKTFGATSEKLGASVINSLDDKNRVLVNKLITSYKAAQGDLYEGSDVTPSPEKIGKYLLDNPEVGSQLVSSLPKDSGILESIVSVITNDVEGMFKTDGRVVTWSDNPKTKGIRKWISLLNNSEISGLHVSARSQLKLKALSLAEGGNISATELREYISNINAGRHGSATGQGSAIAAMAKDEELKSYDARLNKVLTDKGLPTDGNVKEELLKLTAIMNVTDMDGMSKALGLLQNGPVIDGAVITNGYALSRISGNTPGDRYNLKDIWEGSASLRNTVLKSMRVTPTPGATVHFKAGYYDPIHETIALRISNGAFHTFSLKLFKEQVDYINAEKKRKRELENNKGVWNTIYDFLN